MLIVFELKMTKWHNIFARVSAPQEAQRVRNNVCVCHSFYSVTAQLQLWGRRQAPFNSDREAEGAWKGEGSSHRIFFFYTLSHVLPAPCAALVLLSSSVAADMMSTGSSPSATASYYDAQIVFDSFINDELDIKKNSKEWGRITNKSINTHTSGQFLVLRCRI